MNYAKEVERLEREFCEMKDATEAKRLEWLAMKARWGEAEAPVRIGDVIVKRTERWGEEVEPKLLLVERISHNGHSFEVRGPWLKKNGEPSKVQGWEWLHKGEEVEFHSRANDTATTAGDDDPLPDGADHDSEY